MVVVVGLCRADGFRVCYVLDGVGGIRRRENKGKGGREIITESSFPVIRKSLLLCTSPLIT